MYFSHISVKRRIYSSAILLYIYTWGIIFSIQSFDYRIWWNLHNRWIYDTYISIVYLYVCPHDFCTYGIHYTARKNCFKCVRRYMFSVKPQWRGWEAILKNVKCPISRMRLVPEQNFLLTYPFFVWCEYGFWFISLYKVRFMINSKYNFSAVRKKKKTNNFIL